MTVKNMLARTVSLLGCTSMLALAGCEDDAKSKVSGDQNAVADGVPTWHQDVAPLVVEKCGACHVPGGIAPFSMDTYASAKPWAAAMADAVDSGRMPPFLAQETDACQPKLPWANDLRLTPDQRELLRKWADAKAPEGEANKAAELSPPAPVELTREDVIMEWPEEITVEGKKDLHTCIIVDPGLDKDEYVTGRLVKAGNPRVLHHVVSYVIKPSADPVTKVLQTKPELEALIKAEKGVGINGRYDCFGGPALTSVTTEMLDAWAPGGVANTSPEDSGQPIAKDSLVLLDVHYHPVGAPEVDRSKLSLQLGDKKPAFIARSILLGNFQGRSDTQFGVSDLTVQPDESAPEFMIPANATEHVEDMSWTWKLPIGPIRVSGMGTHMHYVGRKMRITLSHKTPTASEDQTECLIETPSYDFNWQRGYAFEGGFSDYPEMRDGDTLHFHCEFDNSMNNRFVVEALADQELSAPIDVRLGEDTLDEMCLGAVGIIYQNVGS